MKRINWVVWAPLIALGAIYMAGVIGSFFIADQESVPSETNNGAVRNIPFKGSKVDSAQLVFDKAVSEETGRESIVTPSMRENIDLRLNEFIVGYYRDSILPDCYLFARLPEGKEKERVGDRISVMTEAMVDTVLGYAEILTAPYPEETDLYALLRLNAIIKEQQEWADKIRYPNGKPAGYDPTGSTWHIKVED